MEDHMNKDDHDAFFDSSDQIRNLHSKCNRMRIVQICGGPFSGKHRQGRELARKVAFGAKSYTMSYCFRVDLLYEMEYAQNEKTEDTLVRLVYEQLEASEHFTEKNKRDPRFHRFLRSHSDKYFVFVFDDADVFGMGNETISLFLQTLKTWTEKCQNLFVIFTSQYQYTLYKGALTHCCKPLDTFSVQFFRQQIDIFKHNCTDAPEVTATDEELKKLAELVDRWPFLILVLADGLVDGFTAKELTELLIKKPLLTLSNEAASQTDQLDSKLKYMVNRLSPRMNKCVHLFADLPDGGKDVTIQEMMQVTMPDEASTANFKHEVVYRLRNRSMLNRNQNNCKVLPFLVNWSKVNFQPSTLTNQFVIDIFNLIAESLNNYVKGDDSELQRCWKQDERKLDELLEQIKTFDSNEHKGAEADEDCDRLIQAAERFLNSATSSCKDSVARFIKEANDVKIYYYGDGLLSPDPLPLKTRTDFSKDNSNHEPTRPGQNGTNDELSVFEFSKDNSSHEPTRPEQDGTNDEPSLLDFSHISLHEQATAEDGGRIVPGSKSFQYL